MKQVLDHLDRSNLLPPLMIIEVLARSQTVMLSAVKVSAVSKDVPQECWIKKFRACINSSVVGLFLSATGLLFKAVER